MGSSPQLKKKKKSGRLQKKATSVFKATAPKVQSPDPLVALNNFPTPIQIPALIKVEKVENIEDDIGSVHYEDFLPEGSVPITSCHLCSALLFSHEGRVIHLGNSSCIFNASPASESVIQEINEYNNADEYESPYSVDESPNSNDEETISSAGSSETPLKRPGIKRKRREATDELQNMSSTTKKPKLLNFDVCDDEITPIIRASYSIHLNDKEIPKISKKKICLDANINPKWSCSLCRSLFFKQKEFMYHSCGLTVHRMKFKY